MTEEIIKRINLLGLKKSHIAKRIGASPSEFSHFLGGRRPLDEMKLIKLKTYLGLN